MDFHKFGNRNLGQLACLFGSEPGLFKELLCGKPACILNDTAWLMFSNPGPDTVDVVRLLYSSAADGSILLLDSHLHDKHASL